MWAVSLLFDGKRFLQTLHTSLEPLMEPAWLLVRLAELAPSLRVHLASRFRLGFSFLAFAGSVGFCKFSAGIGGGLLACGRTFSSSGFNSAVFTGIIVIVVVGGIDIGSEMGFTGIGTGNAVACIFSLFFLTRILITFLSTGGLFDLIKGFAADLYSNSALLVIAPAFEQLAMLRTSQDSVVGDI